MMKAMRSLILTACLCISLAGCSQNPTVAEREDPTAAAVTETTGMPVTEPSIAQTQPSEEPKIQPPEPEDGDFVPVKAYIPDIALDLKYASEENFTGQKIYEFEDVFLRYGTVKKLIKVHSELESMGMGLKIWDGFRPVSAQFALWQVCPDPTYVANPETGHSSHSRGNTVDITLIDENGNELTMPTGFDDFSSLADRDYSDCGETAAENALLLQNVMEKHGFRGYYGEWWHFSDIDTYPVEEDFQPVARSRWYAHCNEFISLRTHPDTGAEVITRIPAGAEFQLLGWTGDFAMVDYDGLWGYVLTGYIQPVQ